MLFSDQLREEAAPIFDAIFNHPYVQGIAKGQLSKEQLIYYVEQDHQFLTETARLFGLGLARCDHRDDMMLFYDRIGLTIGGDYTSHHNLCRIAGVDPEQLKHKPLAPGANHYISYLFKVAHAGTAGEILAAFLPCPWTYFEIGTKIVAEVNPTPDHPFYEWITFYADGIERLPHYVDQLDRFAADATDQERERMRRHFLVSSQLEYSFWDMAYNTQGWPIAGVLD